MAAIAERFRGGNRPPCKGRLRLGAVALTIASACAGTACSTYGSKHAEVLSKPMPDGRQWTTTNLNINTDGSYCYEDAEANCRRYGRLYTWASAQQACRSLAEGWRMPSDDEWRQMAKHYGGVREDSGDSGIAAFAALLAGGHSGFNAVLGGDRDGEGHTYARLDAHGFYWTASESTPTSAWFYNFGKGARSLNRHGEGNKDMAASVRCVRD